MIVVSQHPPPVPTPGTCPTNTCPSQHPLCQPAGNSLLSSSESAKTSASSWSDMSVSSVRSRRSKCTSREETLLRGSGSRVSCYEGPQFRETPPLGSLQPLCPHCSRGLGSTTQGRASQFPSLGSWAVGQSYLRRLSVMCRSPGAGVSMLTSSSATGEWQLPPGAGTEVPKGAGNTSTSLTVSETKVTLPDSVSTTDTQKWAGP